MHRIAMNGVGLLCAALALSGVAVSCSNDDKSRDVGTVQLALRTPDGQTISSVNYVVTNAAGATVVSDVLNVSSPYATASVEVSLRAGTGYSITMTATTSGGSSCTGSATFDVVAAQTAPVALTLTCGGGGSGGEGNGHVVIDATVISGGGGCPDISTATVGPLQVAVGDLIALKATASAMDVSFSWTSTSGVIAAATAASTTLQCTVIGMAQVTLTVSRGETCSDSETFSVNCVQNLCNDLGRNCHVVDQSVPLLAECHSLGHGGDAAVCEARRDECVGACGAALCTLLGSTCHNVDPGSGPLHDCHVLGHAGDAAACFARGRECFDLCTAAQAQQVCTDLGRNCHVVDQSVPLLAECHSLGHAGDGAVCVARQAECVNACGTALCETLASLCHNVDPGSGPLNECHTLGHAGNAAACFARGRECFDLCTAAQGTGGTGGAGGAGGAAGAGGGAGAAGAPGGAGGAAGTGGAAGGAGQGGAGGQGPQQVTIQFRAAVGTEPFACGQTYANQGTAATSVTPRDFRFYVQDLRLINAAGEEVPVTLDVRSPWQAATVALLDFENGQGACLGSGDAGTNTMITGTVPAGTYTGVAFRNGVPEDLNHDDPTTLPALLRSPQMQWSWLTGFRFVKANLMQVGGAAAQQAAETGATGCSGDPGQGTVVCSRPNRNNVVLTGFNPATNIIVADIAPIFASFNLSQTNECHGTGTVCGPMYTATGVNSTTGAALATQAVYRVE